MPRRNAIRISKRSVERPAVEGDDALFWDRNLTRFGIRVHAIGPKVCVAQTRGPTGLSRRVPIGVHGEIALDVTLSRAAAVIDRLGRSEDGHARGPGAAPAPVRPGSPELKEKPT